MTSSSQRVAKNATILMLSQLVTWSLTLLLTFIQPRLLGAVGLGTLHLAESMWALAGVFVIFGMDVLLMKEVARAPEDTQKLLSTAVFLMLPLYVLGFIGVMTWGVMRGYSTSELAVFLIIGLSHFIWNFALAYRSALIGLEKMGAVSKAEIAGKVFNTFVGLLVLYLTKSVIAMAWVNVGMAIINHVFQWTAMRKYATLSFDVDMKYAQHLLRSGVPYMLSALFLAGYVQLDAVIIRELLDTEALGWYSASDRIFGTMLFVPTAFIGATFPVMSRMYANDPEAMPKMMQRSFNFMLILGVPVGFGLLAMAMPIVTLVYGYEFTPSGTILSVMGIVVLLMYLTVLIGRFLISSDRQNAWTKLMAVAIVIAFGCDMLFIPLLERFIGNGAVGGALAYIVTESFMLVAGITMLPKGSLNRGNLWTACKTLAAGLLMIATVWPLRNWYLRLVEPEAFSAANLLIVVPIMFGAFTYCALIFLFRLIPKEDWQLAVAIMPERVKTFFFTFGVGKPAVETAEAVPAGAAVTAEQYMFDGNKNGSNGRKNGSRRRSQQDPALDEFRSLDDANAYRDEARDFGRNGRSQQRFDTHSNGNHATMPSVVEVEQEPTMLPESRADRQQRAKRRNDGTTRDRAIRELPPNMPDFGDASKAPARTRPQRSSGNRDTSNRSAYSGRSQPSQSPNGYDKVVGAPPSQPEPQYENIIGAPPAAKRPAQRPDRPQVEMRRPEQRQRSAFDGSSNRGNTPTRPDRPSPSDRQPAQTQRASNQLAEPIRFDRGANGAQGEAGYSDNGYANFETVKKGRKKGKRRKKKEKVQMPDQKMDVGESLDLRDGTSRLLMRFDAGIVDNLRHMTTRLAANTGEIPSRIALVSSLPGEGVTYVSRALATVMAHDMSARVAYVDLNWWSAGEPEFAHPQNQGLVSVVTGEKRLDEIFVSTTIPNLTLIPGGKLERGDRPIMARSNVLSSAIDVLDRHFDYLIFDIPAIRATNDSVPLAKLAKGVVLVVKQGETPNETVRQAIDEIQHLNVLGVMLNQVKYKTPEFLRRVIPQD